mgnify:CR=1 FL=1
MWTLFTINQLIKIFLKKGPNIIFTVSEKEAFEIPLSEVSNVAMGNKNEVILEFDLDQKPKGIHFFFF